MGKRDTRVAFLNPIALARQKGPKPLSTPSVQDYLNRPRPTWEEVKKVLDDQKKKVGSSTLAAYEDEMTAKFRADLDSSREKRMAESKKKRKKFLHDRDKLQHGSKKAKVNLDDKSKRKSKKHHKKKKRKKVE